MSDPAAGVVDAPSFVKIVTWAEFPNAVEAAGAIASRDADPESVGRPVNG